MRGSPAVLGGFSSLFGMLSVFYFIRLGAVGTCSYELGCPDNPLTVGLLLLFSLGCPVLGLAGAWELGKHLHAGSLALILAGVLPLVPALLLLQVPLYGLAVLFLWWCPLLILAGVLVS